MTNRPRLLYYTETFCSLSETFVYRLARVLRTYEPIIFTHRRIFEEEFPADGLTIVERNRPVSVWPMRALAAGTNRLRHGLTTSEVIAPEYVAALHAKFRLEMLFAHFGTCGIRLLPAANRLGLPLIVMFHGCDLGSWLRWSNYRRCLRSLFARGQAFVTASEFMRTKAIATGCPANKIFVIPYPIPRVSPTPSRSETSEDRPLSFLHVGRLHEQKGVLFSLKAFASVHRDEPNSRFVIVGDGAQRSVAEKLVEELGLQNVVVFKGALPFAQVLNEFLGAHVYVIHSVTASNGDTEGFGVSLAEASAAGLPVVATRHNGFPEVILDGKTGLLVEEGDVEGMAAAMLKLARSAQLRQELGTAGAVYVRENFSEEKVAAQFEALFDSLCAGLSKSARGTRK